MRTSQPHPLAAVTEADAIAKEKAAWDAIKNKDYEAFWATCWMKVRSKSLVRPSTIRPRQSRM